MNKIKLLCMLILLFFSNIFAIEIINGREYDSLEGHWYQIENDSLRWEVVDTMITVKFGDSASEEQIDSINQMYKTTSFRINPVTGFRDLKFEDQDPVALIRNYESENIVNIAEVSLYGEYLSTPNDGRFPISP